MSEPAGAWFAPGRVNLIGEHTDYNDGFVLPFALPQRTVVSAVPLSSPQWTVRSGQYPDPVRFGPDDLRPGAVAGWAGYVAGVVWALREAGHPVPGADLRVDSDVPSGAGLSSSAALECAVLTALADLGGLDIDPAERAELAMRAENDYVGMPCGIMDQTAAIRCRAGHALFLDCRSREVEQIPFDPAAMGLSIVVIDTRAGHAHVGNEFAARRRDCEEAARVLGVASLRDVADLDSALSRLDGALFRLDGARLRRRVRHVVTENQRVLSTVALLKAGQVREIGPLLTASHASLRDDYEVTVPEVDAAVEAALEAGAYGARMTGGGFGGCVIALVDAATADRVGEAVSEEYARRGFTAPATFLAQPSTGASRAAA